MRVPVVVDQELELSRADDVLLGGVPLPRGQVREAGWMSLLLGEGGDRTQPVHTSAAAYWPDGSIKWLHLCGRVSLDSGQHHAMELDTTLLDAAQDLPALQVERRGHDVHISGAAMTVAVGPGVEGLLHAEPSAGGAAAVRGLLPELDVVGPEEEMVLRRCRFVLDEQPVGLPVEQANRVVARAVGRWLDPDDQPMAELRLFVEVIAELAEVRLQPVVIYLGHLERDLIRRCELKFATTLRADAPTEEQTLELIESKLTPVDEPWPHQLPIDSMVYGFGEERGAGYWDRVRPFVPLVRWPACRQVQSGSSYYTIDKRVAPGRSWVKGSEGMHAQGWCHLSNGEAGVTLAVRRYWQEHPTSLAVDASTGEMTLGFWPGSGDPLDMRRYSLIRHGTEAYEYGIGMFPMETHGPAGIGKAREMVLQFDQQGVEGSGLSHAQQHRRVAERALAYLHPLQPMTTGDYFASTEVLGKIAAVDHAAHAEAEREIEQIIDFITTEQRRRGWYGLMNYGDILTAFYSEIDRWGYDDGGYGWVNTEHLPDLGLWLNALRAGRSDWLAMAVNMTRHNRDVDTYHAGNFIGTGTRHNVQHWGDADKEWRVTMPLVRRLHYYVTADPWTAEVINATIDNYRSYTRTSNTAPSMASALVGLAVRWEMTGSAEDRQPLLNMADLYAKAFRDDGQYYKRLHANITTGEGHIEGDEIAGNVFFMDGFGGQHILCELAEMLDHEGLLTAMSRYAKAPAYKESRGPGEKISRLASLALAHRQTGSDELLSDIRETLAASRPEMQKLGGPGLLDTEPHRSPANMTRRNKYACGLARYLHAVPYGLRAMADADKD